jgi:hypothetical protein
MSAWILLLTAAFAGSDPCAAIKTKTDAFTGQPTRSYLAPGGWQLVEASGAFTLTWEVTSVEPIHRELPAQTTLQVRLEDGAIVGLTSRDIALPDVHLVGKALFTTWRPTWDLRPEVAQQIAASKPAAMMVEAIGQKWTMVAGFAPAFQKLHEVVRCMVAPTP